MSDQEDLEETNFYPFINYEYVEEFSDALSSRPHMILASGHDESLIAFYCNDMKWNGNLLLAAAKENPEFAKMLFEVCNAIRSHRANQAILNNMN